jgi:hypothetical protein
VDPISVDKGHNNMQGSTYSDKGRAFWVVTSAPKRSFDGLKGPILYIHMASQIRQGHENIQRASQFCLDNTNDIK